MKYGSLDNMMMDANNPEKAEVGMKATILSWTDRHPAVVTAVNRDKKSGKVVSIEVQELEWTPEPFPCGYAKEVHMDKPKGSPYVIKVATRGKKKGMLAGISLGIHDAYRDPSF